MKLEQFQIPQKVKDSPDFIHGAVRCMHSFALMMGDMTPGNQIRVIQISWQRHKKPQCDTLFYLILYNTSLTLILGSGLFFDPREKLRSTILKQVFSLHHDDDNFSHMRV